LFNIEKHRALAEPPGQAIRKAAGLTSRVFAAIADEDPTRSPRHPAVSR
jgi:hypothetical protein